MRVLALSLAAAVAGSYSTSSFDWRWVRRASSSEPESESDEVEEEDGGTSMASWGGVFCSSSLLSFLNVILQGFRESMETAQKFLESMDNETADLKHLLQTEYP